MASSTSIIVCNFLLQMPGRKERPLVSLVDEPGALTFKSKAVKMACDPSGAGRRNGLVASCLNVDAPGVTPTRGAQMYTGGQKISAGVRDCPKDKRGSALRCAGADPSMWDTAAAGSSSDPALAASAAAEEVCDISSFDCGK